MTNEVDEFSSLEPLLKKFSKYSDLRSWSAIMLGLSVLFVIAGVVFHSTTLLIISIVIVGVFSPLLMVFDSKAGEYIRKANRKTLDILLSSFQKNLQKRNK